MVNHEVRTEKDAQHNLLRTKATTGLAAAALLLHLTSCSSETQEQFERQAPQSADYSLDTSNDYRESLENWNLDSGDQAVREHLETLKETPVAEWLYDDSDKVNSALITALEKSLLTDTIPQFVLYNIPQRDLGSYSAGGASSTEAYLYWVQKVSDTIADQPAVVVVEPDALPHAYAEGAIDERRVATLASAIDLLYQNTNTASYLDVGNSTWLSVDQAAALLKAVDAQSEYGVHGISLNVANYQSEEKTRAYAKSIQEAYGQELFLLIDNSRNGSKELADTTEWCNPADQTLGTIDVQFDAEATVETAFIKTPGQSDGECGISDKPAGTFDDQLLLQQLK